MTMLTTTPTAPRTRLRDIVAGLAPRRFRFDLLGLFSGYRAYLVHSRLNAKSDAELAEVNLTRKDLPWVAMEAIFEQRGR